MQNSARSAVFRRSFKKAFPAAVRGEGVYVWDSDGQRYLDFSGSAAVNFIGHGVQEISVAMAEQAKHLEFVHTSQFNPGRGRIRAGVDRVCRRELSRRSGVLHLRRFGVG